MCVCAMNQCSTFFQVHIDFFLKYETVWLSDMDSNFKLIKIALHQACAQHFYHSREKNQSQVFSQRQLKPKV